jgi:hypothetical protein
LVPSHWGFGEICRALRLQYCRPRTKIQILKPQELVFSDFGVWSCFGLRSFEFRTEEEASRYFDISPAFSINA